MLQNKPIPPAEVRDSVNTDGADDDEKICPYGHCLPHAFSNRSESMGMALTFCRCGFDGKTPKSCKDKRKECNHMPKSFLNASQLKTLTNHRLLNTVVTKKPAGKPKGTPAPTVTPAADPAPINSAGLDAPTLSDAGVIALQELGVDSADDLIATGFTMSEVSTLPLADRNKLRVYAN